MNDKAHELRGRELTIEGRRFTVAEVEDRAASEMGPAFTRMEIRAEPALRIDLAFAADWNGRLYVHGNGGFAGEAVDTPLRDPLRNMALAKGFAVAGSNTGHDETVDILGSFASDPDKLADYAHRAVHQTAAVAKEVIALVHGRQPDFSYFEGCSTGGRQALMSAQRYPDDFDGIICGAPVFDFTGSQLWGVKTGQILEGTGIGDREMQVVAKALREKAIDQDQLVDGLIVDPLHLDFNVLRDVPICDDDTPEDGSITRKQAEAFAAIYATSDIGKGRTFPGIPFGAEFIGDVMPGLEPASGWAGWFYRWDAGFFAMSQAGIRADFGETFLKYFLGYEGSWKDFDFSDASLEGVEEVADLMNATDPDLSSFAQKGGKILMYHGLADAALNPARAALYFDEMRATLSTSEVEKFARLYLVPGMFHCFGGYGPSMFDMLTPLMDWVENGHAPQNITAAQAFSETPRTRPLCPYPCVAKYRGTGDVEKAESFTCDTIN